jgi:hypothetical protein
MSMGPEGGHGDQGGQGSQPGQPGPWPPPGNTPQWQQQGPPPGGGWPGSPPGPAGPGGPGGPGGLPGGPGGPPPWGTGPGQPYGYGPPPQQPRKKGGAGVLLAIGGGVLALIILVVIVVAVSGGSGDDPKKTSGKAAAQAGQALGKAGGASYTGTYGGSQATFSVTKAGSAHGSYSSHGSPVSRVDIGDATYIKADSSFWSAQGQSSTAADKADGKWAKAPDSASDLKLADLSPTKLAQVLQQAGNDPQAVNTPAGSTPAIKMTVSETTYYISKSSPHRLLRVEGTAGSDSYALDVKPLSGAAAMGPVFSQLRSDVQNLKNAYDPAISMLPMGKIQFGSCSESGCTVRGSVMPSSVAGSTSSVHVTMNARFWGDGPTVSTCKGTGTTTPSHQTTISCRASGGSWTSWYRSHNGRFTIHASSTFDATVNSSGDVNELLGKLSQEQQGS